MTLGDDLIKEIEKIFAEPWTLAESEDVPETEDLPLSNEAVKVEAAVLYADLVASTELVDRHKREFVAELYKAYLYGCSKLISAQGGEIRSFDGDRVMGVYTGDSKNTAAARSALKINYLVSKIIIPSISAG